MQRHAFSLLLAGVVTLAACSTSDTLSPGADLGALDVIEVLPDYADPTTAMMDRGGIGGAQLPDSLALSTEQKAAIQKLKDAFETANAADIARLKAIETEAKAARAAGKSRAEVRAILEKAIPIRTKLESAFEALRTAIWAIYTPAQKAWLEANRPKQCGPDGGPKLTEAQLAQIKALREAFRTANAADLELLKSVGEEARAARQAGKSEAEIKAILAKAAAARERVRTAEKNLQDDIMGLLTAEQRAAWCVGRGMRGPGGPMGRP